MSAGEWVDSMRCLSVLVSGVLAGALAYWIIEKLP